MRDLEKVEAGRRDFAKAAGLAVLAVVVGVGVALWWLPARSPAVEGGGDATAGHPAAPAVDGAVPELNDRADKREGGRRKRMGAEDLVGEPGCRIHRGIGAARDAAAAVVANGADSHFAVVDGAGVAFAGSVPFRVDRAQLGRRGDGALVAAFGSAGDGRLAVFLNGRMLADERGVADFGLARDGAEWFLVRQEAEKGFHVQRVEQNDTVSGARHSFILTRVRDTGAGLSHRGFYSPVANELIFEPRHPDDSYDNSFILRSPEGKTRVVRMQAVQGLVESNAHLYVLEEWRNAHSIAKQAFRWEAAPEERLVTVWSRVERVAPATVRMFLSDDAAWLGLFGWRLVVFDVVSGDTVLQFPLRGDKEAEFARLRDVLPADATVADVGQATDARIAHGLLLLRRTVPRRGAARSGASAEVVDVFRMNGLPPDGQPDARVAADDLYRCMAATTVFPLPAMRVDADGVAYGSPPRSPSAGIRPVPQP